MKSVYICHPLRGKTGTPEEIRGNPEKIDKLCLALAEDFKEHLILSPLHAFSFYDPRGPQEQVMGQCLAMLDKSDELWVFDDWKNSRGCRAEIEYAKQQGKKVRFVTSAGV